MASTNKKALIIQGGWSGHEPKDCADLFASKMPERGFDVEVADSLEVLEDIQHIQAKDLIVPIWTMGTITTDQERNLVDAVLGGVGLAGFHGGMCDSFRGAVEYQWMTGGQFLCHPDGVKDYRIRIVNHDDPITQGMEDFDVRSEQYYMLVDPNNEVLVATTHKSESAPWTDGVEMPFVWKKMHGKGRVFYSAMGHVCQEFTDYPQQLEITLRGMSWATR